MHVKVDRKYAPNGVTIRLSAVQGNSQVFVGKRFFTDRELAEMWAVKRWSQFMKASRSLRQLGYL